MNIQRNIIQHDTDIQGHDTYMTSYAAHAPHIHKKTNTGYISHTPTHTDTLRSSHTLTHIGTLHTSHILTHTGTLHTPHTPPTHEFLRSILKMYKKHFKKVIHLLRLLKLLRYF